MWWESVHVLEPCPVTGRRPQVEGRIGPGRGSVDPSEGLTRVG